MTTDRQTCANRANATASTGPRTDAGKATCAQNALTHGAYARKSVAIRRGLLAEDPEEMNEFIQDVVAALRPRDAIEYVQATRIAFGFWKLNRGNRFAALALAADGTEHLASFEAIDLDIGDEDGTLEGRAERAACRALAGTLAQTSRIDARMSSDLDRALLVYERLQQREIADPGDPSGETEPISTSSAIGATEGDNPGVTDCANSVPAPD